MALPSAVEQMNERDFAALKEVVYALTGIVLADTKRMMLTSRLAPRLRALGLGSFEAYREFLGTRDGRAKETQALINAVTTNKTAFFREAHQFDHLVQHLIPRVVERRKKTGQATVRIWSAASSTGEEPWTLAMVLAESLPQPSTWDVKVLGTDLDTEVLAKAKAGIYGPDQVGNLSPERVKRFLPRVRDGAPGRHRISDELRPWLTFQQLNLIAPQWPVQQQFDLILCRNVSIYFDAPTQQRLFTRLADLVADDGWLYVGHAEVLPYLNDRLEPTPGGIYRRRPRGTEKPAASAPLRLAAPPPRPSAPAPVTPRLANLSAHEAGLVQHSISVGEMHASPTPVEVRTLLGSCVAACLYDPVAKVGGMNHFLLPKGSPTELLNARFGVHAMETLINELMREGADRRRLVAKLFGGANVLAVVTQRPTVGERNAEFARAFLEREKIPLQASRLGGENGLEVRFHTHTGRVFVKPIQKDLAELETLERKEQQAPAQESGTVDLWI